jgi:tRNA 2-thiouridine synthesizing protein A
MAKFLTANDEDEAEPAMVNLLATFRRIERGRCHDCGELYVGAEALFSIALGFRDSPRCLPCLAQGLSRDAADLREQLVEYIERKDCYRRVWGLLADKEEYTRCAPRALPSEPATPIEETDEAVADWDAGDMACGELVLALRNRLKSLPSGGLLRLTALDPAAPVDIPSWCRLTGHALVNAEHPVYLIRRS